MNEKIKPIHIIKIIITLEVTALYNHKLLIQQKYIAHTLKVEHISCELFNYDF